MRKLRILVVEDSLVFRQLLVKCINSDPMLEVVAEANDPYEARDAIIEYKPDVMTLDVELPRMNGIEFLRKLMPQYPIPTVVISALANASFDAVEAGAVDFVEKPSGLSSGVLYEFMRTELITKIKIASTVKVSNLKRLRSTNTSPINGNISNKNMVVAIGASTGGTEAILEVLKGFGRDIPGVVIVQHMPPGFTKMYADRLNDQCLISVKEAQTGDLVLPGQALLAPGDKHMRLIKVGGQYQVECKAGEKVSGHCPSVDVLFESVANVAGANALGIILTGMGGDGSKGMLKMHEKGAVNIGQDEASCIVYGMPKVAYEIGAVDYQVSLSNIAQRVYGILDK